MFGRADATTSTDDVTSRPLCLFYFTHPFGVLSPEAPTVVSPYMNMRGDVASGSHDARPMSPPVHADVWYNTTSHTRRVVPYNAVLPPLRVYTPRYSPPTPGPAPAPLYLRSQRLSLPPLEAPPARKYAARRRVVRKSRAHARSGVRRLLAALLRRARTEGAGDASLSLRDALHTIRDAWSDKRRIHSGVTRREAECGSGMLQGTGALGARPDASPGLLRRRYSVPETVMRRYRLAQQRSDSEESAPHSSRSVACVSPARTKERVRLGRVTCECRASRDTQHTHASPAPVHTAHYTLTHTQNNTAHTAHTTHTHAVPPHRQNINIDEYVSKILMESLNSLTDQLECMNASIATDRKISIVEKEIKVKLQNTGVNTIVHLSPTSNNQIIFGNEELCNDKTCDLTDNNALSIREEVLNSAYNNNRTSVEPPRATTASTPPCDTFDIHHDRVNQTVLQQIQKLFQEKSGAAPSDLPPSDAPRIEICDVEAFLESAESAEGGGRVEGEHIGAVCAGAYTALVPRYSALPHTDSMEVNTSSSDDAELAPSDCTSLVDSLDDPNSPRSLLLRTPRNRRSELVRSAIDVLDLLPESARGEESLPPRDKAESFFIRIEDNERDRDKENINVADRMPEKIKQRLYRRNRNRERRLETARRTGQTTRVRAGLQRDCIAIVNALIDEVIAKIAQDEYKCMRIQHRPPRLLVSKSNENVTNTKRTWRRELEPIDDRESFKAIKNRFTRADPKQTTGRHRLHGKPTPPLPIDTDDRAHNRIYQKSEIRDGTKCIEILEILEYINCSQSSTGIINSDENHNVCMKNNKKSRIPVPISERAQRCPGLELHRDNNNKSESPHDGTGRTRFRQVFAAIPEERSPARTRSAATSPVSASTRHRATMTSPRALYPPCPSAGVNVKVAECDTVHTHRSSESSGAPPRLSRALSCERLAAPVSRDLPAPHVHMTADKRKHRASSVERSEGGASGGSSGSSASQALPRRAPRRRAASDAADDSWSVTVSGRCRASLPADVEMRVRFPHKHTRQECWCRPPPPAPPAVPPHLTLTMKKEALDSSILASKSLRKSHEHLPEVETYRESRSKLKSSVKTRRGRGCSLHCWLPEENELAPAPVRARNRNGLSVSGSAIVPELKPRVRTNTERDLTRVSASRRACTRGISGFTGLIALDI